MPGGTTMPSPPAQPAPLMIPSTGGTELATYDFGGTGRNAVLVHANGFCAAVWTPLVEVLAPWRCVTMDARAHGRSTGGGDEMAWEGHRDDVLAVLDGLDLERPVGIGHSMGGAALLLAEQVRPGTFASLWLYEPIVFPPMVIDDTGGPLAEGALRRRDTFADEAAAFANYATKPPLSELDPRCLAAYVHHGFAPTAEGITLRCRPEDEAAGYRMGGRHRAWEHLGEVQCPVTVVRGADVAFGPAQVAPEIARLLPEGRLEDHPELGHFGPLAAIDTVAASIRRTAE